MIVLQTSQRFECRVFKIEFCCSNLSASFSETPFRYRLQQSQQKASFDVDYGSCMHVMRKDCTTLCKTAAKNVPYRLRILGKIGSSITAQTNIQESGTIVQYVNKVTPTESK